MRSSSSLGERAAGNPHQLNHSAAHNCEMACFVELVSNVHHSVDNTESWGWLMHSNFQLTSWFN